MQSRGKYRRLSGLVEFTFKSILFYEKYTQPTYMHQREISFATEGASRSFCDSFNFNLFLRLDEVSFLY